MDPLREENIRPKDLQEGQAAAYARDVARLVADQASFVEVECPACGGSHAAPRFEKYGLSFGECTGCGTVYMSPRPTPEILERYYASSENYAYWAKYVFPASEKTRRERIFGPRVDRVIELCKKRGLVRPSLVDVGAGFGTFLEEARARQYFGSLTAVEPTPELAASCRARGLNVFEGRVETFTPAQRVDVITSFEVIEHLFDPGAFMKACAKHLSPRGVVLLTCPNVRGFDVDVLGEGSPAIDTEHLNYFHPKSLELLAERSGLVPLEVLTPGVLDASIVRNRVLDGTHTLVDPFLRRVLIDEWDRVGAAFQEFLTSAGLSSNMWLVAGRAP